MGPAGWESRDQQDRKDRDVDAAERQRLRNHELKAKLVLILSQSYLVV